MINVILADHERIFRAGMISALAAEDDIRVVAHPDTPTRLIHGVENFRPHVLVLSSAFLGHIDSIQHACKRHRTAMLLLQDHGSAETLEYFSEFQGAVHRSADEATVVRYIRQLARGGRVIRLTPFDSPGKTSDSIGMGLRQRLTPHELGIVAFVVQGYRNHEIAVRLGATEQSIKRLLRRIFDKTGVYGRLELALFMLHYRVLAKTPAGQYASSMPAPAALALNRWDGSRRPSIN